MVGSDSNKRLTRSIDEISKNIWKKYRALKHGITIGEERLRKSFKPILEPLETITRKLNEPKLEVKTMKDDDVDDERGDTPLLTKRQLSFRDEDAGVVGTASSGSETPVFLRTHVLAETPEEVSAKDIIATPEGRQEARAFIESTFRGPLARKYLHMLVSGERDRLMDHVYGVRHDDNKWMIGDSALEIDTTDDFHIKGVRYKGTPGLYELMFMREPKKTLYDANDLAAYRSILLATNAYKQNYVASAQVNSNKGYKYKQIISRLVGKRFGRGHDVAYMTHTPTADILCTLGRPQRAGRSTETFNSVAA